MTVKRRILTALLLLLVTLVSAMAFVFCYRYDNKYTRPRPPGHMGTVILEQEWYQDNPCFYLADGWAFYQGKLLSPEEIPNHTPDRYFYIGRYGGFDLGNGAADPHGQGTYRIMILIDREEREYALELTPIYSRWRIWINGSLVQSVGMGDDSPSPPVGLITFTASDRIEIVVSAADDSNYYSGMIYPPAFGVPRMVSFVSSIRLLIHTIVCAAALLIGLLCILMEAGNCFSRPYSVLAALCLCFSGSTAWPLYQILEPGKNWLLLIEMVCYYGIFLSLIWIQGKVCGLPEKVYYPACGVGLLICLGIMIQPHLFVSSAAPLYAWSGVLGIYKWFTGAWLLLTGGWAVYRSKPYSLPILAGNCVFACALWMDKLLPVYEPVFTGWFVELAGGVLILLTAGLSWYDMRLLQRDRVRLMMQQELSRFQLNARKKYAALQQEYVRKTREQLHESRSQFTLIKHYLDTGQQDKLEEYLNKLTLSARGLSVCGYTGHSLADAILTIQLSKAEQAQIYTYVEADSLPGGLWVSDSDLTSLLMNLMNNAIEACERLPESGERWISMDINCRDGNLTVICSNSSVCEEPAVRTSKDDKQAHGYGLKLIGEIAKAYGGGFLTEWEADSFTARLYLPGVLEDGDTP